MSLSEEEEEEAYSEFEFSDSDLESVIEFENEVSPISKSPYTNRTIESIPLTVEQLVDTYFQPKFKLLQSILNAPVSSDYYLLLQSNNWDENTVINQYMEDENKARKKAGLVPYDAEYAVRLKKSGLQVSNDFMCPICCDDDEQLQYFSLLCGHKYCLSCYKRYIQDRIVDGVLIKCPEMDCHLNLSYGDIDCIFGSSSTVSGDLLMQSAKHYVDTNSKTFKWCPAPDCTSLVHNEDSLESFNTIASIPIVKCSFKHNFCFNCNYENHVPVPCAIVQLWIEKCIDDSETAHWLHSNTQQCPTCGSSIEKNGGCNHMTCRTCKKEFCWICLGDWSQHGTQFFKCNRYNENDSKYLKTKQEQNRKLLHRYLFYYDRFRIHESSMKKDEEVAQQVEMKIKELQQEANISYIEAQFLSDAAETLLNGRKTLKWTYTFAYYLKRNNFSQIFESNQDYLNKVVEDLSELFESKKVMDILKKKPQFVNQSRLVKMRQNTLIESANDGVMNKRMEFELDIDKK